MSRGELTGLSFVLTGAGLNGILDGEAVGYFSGVVAGFGVGLTVAFGYISATRGRKGAS